MGYSVLIKKRVSNFKLEELGIIFIMAQSSQDPYAFFPSGNVSPTVLIIFMLISSVPQG